MWFHSIIISLLILLNIESTVAIEVPFGWIRNPQPNVYVLGGNIGLTMQNYSVLERKLAEAKPGDKIRIILYNNSGGMAYIGEELHRAIESSKATITTEARLWAASAALDVLFSGEYLYLKKEPYVNRFIAIGIAHLSFIPGPNDTKLRTQASIDSDIQEMQYYRNFLSEDEWNRVKRGDDVYLYANTLCANAKIKIDEDEKHCLIKNPRVFQSLSTIELLFNF